MAELDLTNIVNTSISTPSSGVTALFVDTDKKLKIKNDAGTVQTIWNMYSQSIPTAAGTTTLTNTSPITTVYTGVTTQTVKLPDATTIQVGQVYEIRNNSTGLVTIQDGNAGALIVLSSNTSVIFTLLTAGTVAGVWATDPIAFYADITDTTKKIVQQSSGASTGTILTIAEAQTTSQTLNVPNIAGSSIIITDTLAQNITGVKTMTNMTTAAGTTAIPSMTITGGTNLTSVTAGAVENDSVAMYASTNTTDGRAHVPARQHFRLTSNGGAITTIANVFGTTSNISLVASAYYNIEIVMWFLKSSTGDALTITLTNSSAPTSQNIRWEQSPITGVVAPPGTATALIGHVQNDATAAKAITTGTLTASVNHYIKINLELKNGTGTNLKIQATNATGVTPLLGSYWTATRIPTGNTGTFAA